MNKKTAFIFPGQGSQAVGMLDKYLLHSQEYKDVIINSFGQASDILGYDALEVAQKDPFKQLNRTQYTQPILLIVSYIFWKLWLQKGGFWPDYMTGHSLGEYSALLCSDSLTFIDAVKLVKVRAELMQEAVPDTQGSMAVIIGLNSEQVIDICCSISTADKIVEAVNFNSPGQIVISGHCEPVNFALEKAIELGAKLTKILPITVPSHSSLMKAVTSNFAEVLNKTNITSPKIPVINNVDIKIYTEPTMIKQALVKQLYSPVNWINIVELLIKLGVGSFIECGPGKVLNGLSKRINRKLELQTLSNPDYIVSTIEN